MSPEFVPVSACPQCDSSDLNVGSWIHTGQPGQENYVYADCCTCKSPLRVTERGSVRFGAWDFEGYWLAVFGDRSAEQAVAEFDLSPEGLAEWLDTAEQASLYKSSEGWEHFSKRALQELSGACEE